MQWMDGTAPGAGTVLAHRRAVLAAGLALAAFGARAAAEGAADTGILFLVRRNGSDIGRHSVSFTRTGTRLTAHIEAQFRVGFGPITFYRYHHRATEIWRDGHFISFESQTDDNGTRLEVQAHRGPSGIAISATNQANVTAAPDALPLTHWAVAAMSAPLFNPENGKKLREVAHARGPGTVRLADGKQIQAVSYTLAGEAPIEDWYDDRSVWAALDATGKDGSKITYRRQTV